MPLQPPAMFSAITGEEAHRTSMKYASKSVRLDAQAGGNGQQHADHDRLTIQHVDVDPGDLRIQLGKGAGLRGDPARTTIAIRAPTSMRNLFLPPDLLRMSGTVVNSRPATRRR